MEFYIGLMQIFGVHTLLGVSAYFLILTGQIQQPGVHIPVSPEIYNPVLDELATMGIRCVEKTMPQQ